jgi:hypothetical protein
VILRPLLQHAVTASASQKRKMSMRGNCAACFRAASPGLATKSEREAIAPQVRNFVRQAEQERSHQKGRGVSRDEGLNW